MPSVVCALAKSLTMASSRMPVLPEPVGAETTCDIDQHSDQRNSQLRSSEAAVDTSWLSGCGTMFPSPP